VPSIKLASNSALFKAMGEDIDVNCGSILDGEHTVVSSGEEIFKKIISIASGARSKSELLGYGDVEFNPWKIGAVV
jgi:altronate hydrolase